MIALAIQAKKFYHDFRELCCNVSSLNASLPEIISILSIIASQLECLRFLTKISVVAVCKHYTE